MLHDKFPSAVKREFEIDSEEHWCSKNVNLMKKTVTPGQETVKFPWVISPPPHPLNPKKIRAEDSDAQRHHLAGE